MSELGNARTSGGIATSVLPRPCRGVSAADGRPAAEPRDAAGVVETLIAQSNDDLVLLCPEYVDRAPEFRPELLDAAVQRGVRVRAVWSLEVARTPGARRCGAVLSGSAMSPRMLAQIPVRAVLADNRVAVVYRDPRKARVERDPAAIESLAGVVRQLWDRASEPNEALWDTGDKRDIGNRHETVLRLLSDGLTDDAVARRIGVSVRTVRNDVATAMQELGARSRFQAGVQAARLGLI